MKKDSFIKGAMISTICIVLSKILGIIYVIPFHSIIGTSGRALYGYAYNVYMLFLQFSTVGIPLAISKMISEYHSLGYEDAKRRTYRIALQITFIMAILSTVILFISAPMIAEAIIGGVNGGNTKEDITFVLRVSTTAILICTMLSGMRGYLQGHKYITPSSISQVIEQLVRVIIIIFGSYIAIQLWGTKEAVGIAIFGATAGAIVAFFYLEKKMKEERKKEKEKKILEEEKKISNQYLFKQLIRYTIPFVIVSIAVPLYNTIDMFSIVKPLIKYTSLTTQDAETVLAIITTWGAKLNVIVTAIASGLVVSVLPNITSDFIKKKEKEVNRKINKTLQIIIYFVLPMVVGLSFLAEPVWCVFYDRSHLGVLVFAYSIITAFFYSLFLNLHTILQAIDHHKAANRAILLGLLTKLILTVPSIPLFAKIGIPAYYGPITVTIIAYLIPMIVSIYDLKKSLHTSFQDTIKKAGISALACLIMLVVLSSLKLLIPLSGNRLYSTFIICIYAGIGALIYFFITIKTNVFSSIFGCNLRDFMKKKLRKVKRN